MRGEFNRFFIIKKNREVRIESLKNRALTELCTVVKHLGEHSQGFSIFELLIARDWSKRITWPNIPPPPGKLGNIVFPRISARAQISALPRISAHQLGQTSNKRPLRIRPPLNQFQISRETNKTWFYCQFIHNRKRQRDQQRIIVSLTYQLFLSPCACRVPLCVLSVLLNFCHIAALLANAVIFPGITRPFSSLRGPVISSIIELLGCVWRA